MKKRLFTSFIVVCMTLFILVGCDSYSSRYKAVAFLHSNTEKDASMNFSSFEGTMVFKMKCESEEEKIRYSANLESGSIKVFYDCNGTKIELCSVHDGDDISESGGVLSKGKVYIIVETTETAKDGVLTFNIQ